MFEDGKVVNNITYSNFKHGRVLSQSKRNRTGETRLMHCGMKATITDYRSSRDIDIEFEDGTVVKNINYNNFKTGSVLNRNSHVNKGKQKIGTTKMMKCGLLATLVDYRDYDDIDVQFEDGKVVYHKRYCNFLRGSIGYADKKHRIEK
jgi:hypothetical protein